MNCKNIFNRSGYLYNMGDLFFNFLIIMPARRFRLIVLTSLLGRSCKAARNFIMSSRCWLDIAYIALFNNESA